MKDKTIGPIIKVSFGIGITLIAAALIVTALGALFVDTPLLDLPPAEQQIAISDQLDIISASVTWEDVEAEPEPVIDCTVEALILCRRWQYCKTCKPACDVSDEFWDRVEAKFREQCGLIDLNHGNTE